MWNKGGNKDTRLTQNGHLKTTLKRTKLLYWMSE